jgi:hypothetical protein
MPEREWILLNPGPANTSRSVRGALVMPDLCHREPEFSRVQHGNAHAPGHEGRGRRVSGQLVRAGREGRTVTPEADR